jgi:hypothetical protein
MERATGWTTPTGRNALLAAAFICLASLLTGCVYERSEKAAEAKKILIGTTKSRVLECMGAPDETLTYASSETLSYNSRPAEARLFCKVDIGIANGVVSRIQYNGDTGGLLTPDEQCAPIVEKCIANRSPTVPDKVIDIFKF